MPEILATQRPNPESAPNTTQIRSKDHHALATSAGEVRAAWLIYDGDCPFCRSYVRYLRIRESLGPLHLVDARQGGTIVEEVRAAALDLDEGMVLKIGGRLYSGSECIQVLASLSSRSTLFNRMNAFIFRSAILSRWLYPALRAGRNTVLHLLGRARIGKG